jgi:sigma-B regulation protein RsbU (phosphoserine phosphatase)
MAIFISLRRCVCRKSTAATVLLPLLATAHSASAQLPNATFDATKLHAPAYLGATGVISSGDNVAFARPDFDDSSWLPVDDKKTMRELFPNSLPQVVWQRMRIKVDPAQTGMGLEASGISQAYEVYVNGQRLIESGQVDPFIQYTEDARIVVPIQDAQVKTGFLTIAIRARALPRWWKGTGPSFPRTMLSIGQEDALRDHASMVILRREAMGWALQCIGIAVGLVSLALFNAQRQRFEYMWLSLAGLSLLADLPVSLIGPFKSLPANLTYAGFAINSLGGLFITLMILAFVRQKIGNWSRICLIICAILPIVVGWLSQNNIVPANYYEISQIPYQIIATVLVLIVLLLHWRRGNREAGILLVPMILWSLSAYLFAAFLVLKQIPSMHSLATRQSRSLAEFAIGGFEIGIGNLTALLFFLSIGVIVLRRSSRMIHQQALHEGELAATREIQKVILPESIEDLPGFKIETAYRPAQEVGGDFFQVLPTGDGGLLVVVGDVAGKGLPAAMLVSLLVGAIRGVFEYTKTPAELLANLNERLVGRGGGGFSTAVAVHIAADGGVSIANAGHLPPYLDGREVELPGAFPLGVMKGASFDTTNFHMPQASRITFYSDGVVEAQNQRGELLGFERAQVLSTQSAAAIVAAAKEFGQSDDITVVAITRLSAIANAA